MLSTYYILGYRLSDQAGTNLNFKRILRLNRCLNYILLVDYNDITNRRNCDNRCRNLVMFGCVQCTINNDL